MARQVPARNGGTLTRPEKGDPGGPGRPPKLLSKMVADLKKKGFERVTASTMLGTIETMIGLPADKLMAMSSDEKAPIAQRILADHLMNKADRLTLLMELLDRAHGKAKQSLELTEHSGTRVIGPAIPDEG